ncbi:MAG: hypothetical protein KDC44_15370, partial [Phaeodactylibacter sp.]|nr:hypothetical protein [Phaeodactylibacter sp.]
MNQLTVPIFIKSKAKTSRTALWRVGLSTLLLFILILPVQSQSFIPDITVAQDGSGDFTTIQAAINAVEDNSEEPTLIYIKVGLYDTEKLLVPANKTNVVLIDESRDETILSYHVHNCSSGGFNGLCPAEDAMLWAGELLQTAATLT